MRQSSSVLGSSWAPSPYCSPPRSPFPIKSPASSACVSPWTIHFQVLDKSPLSDHRRGSPSSNSHVWLLVTLWTIACQVPVSVGFSRQEYWSGLPFPSPGDLPDPGIKPRSPALQADSLPSEPSGKPHKHEEKMNYSGFTKCFQYEKHDVCHKQRALTSGEAISSRHRWTLKKNKGPILM